MLTVWPQVAMSRVAGLWHKRQSRPATEFIAWLGGNGSWIARGFEAFELFGLVEINLGLVPTGGLKTALRIEPMDFRIMLIRPQYLRVMLAGHLVVAVVKGNLRQVMVGDHFVGIDFQHLAKRVDCFGALSLVQPRDTQ